MNHELKDGESMSGNAWAVLYMLGEERRIPVFARSRHEGWITALGCTPLKHFEGVVIEYSGDERWTATRTGDEVTVVEPG